MFSRILRKLFNHIGVHLFGGRYCYSTIGSQIDDKNPSSQSKVPILYLSGTLPTLSETFVYREILALRSIGLEVYTASVMKPAHGLDDGGALDEMARTTIEIYSKGIFYLLKDAIAESITYPIRSIRTMSRCILDAAFSEEVPLSRKPKVIYQGLAAMALVWRIRRFRIGHIHAHMAHVPTTIAMYAAHQLGTGFSFTGHAVDLFPNRTLLKEKLKRGLFINCISYWHRDFYRSIHDRPDSDYPVVRCGVNTRQYEASPAPCGDRLRILSVGRLVPKKGMDVLLSAVGTIAKRGGPPIKVIIAGNGPENGKLQAIANALPPNVQVEMLGETDNDSVMKLMSSVDVFVLPCRIANSGDRDGIPVVLMEAMACGRCVISGDLATIRELIEPNQSGILIPPGDIETLARELISLDENRSRIEILGKAARNRVEREFDTFLNANRIIRTLQDRKIACNEVGTVIERHKNADSSKVP